MFSGLVTAQSSVLQVKEQDSLLELILKRPASMKDLKIGESLSIDGVCLTLKKFDEQSMSFDLGPETLKVTQWSAKKLENKVLNVERSLSMKDLIGGQILTGHVDGMALVTQIKKEGESCLLSIQIPKEFKKFVWKKAYLALNGVSLTVNKIKKTTVDFCLIPETLKQTNLSLLKKGDSLNFEVDYIGRSSIHAIQSSYEKIKWFFTACLFLLLVSNFLLLFFIFTETH